MKIKPLEFVKPTWENISNARELEITKLKQERDELAAQVEVMRVVVRDAELWYSADTMIGKALKQKASEALSITPSEALREIRARVLEEKAQELRSETLYKENFRTEFAGWLDVRAAAERKGE